MKTHNPKKVVRLKLFSHNSKVKKMQEILLNLFSIGNPLISEWETDILRMILVENKSVQNVADKFNRTPATINLRFKRAIRRIKLRYANLTKELKNAIALQNEVKLLESKLQRFEKIERVEQMSPETKKILLMDIKEFDFSKRVLNAFDAADICTVADILKISKTHLLYFRGVGKYSVYEIEDFLQTKGLKWEPIS